MAQKRIAPRAFPRRGDPRSWERGRGAIWPRIRVGDERPRPAPRLPPSPHLSSFSWSRSSRAPSSRSSRCLVLSSPQSPSARLCPEGSGQAVSPEPGAPASPSRPRPVVLGARPLHRCLSVTCRHSSQTPGGGHMRTPSAFTTRLSHFMAGRPGSGGGVGRTEGKPQAKKAAEQTQVPGNQ